MKPIRKGDRGVAVEDVQRRLISLGADLGPSGVDGVFLGATYAAVREFQRESRLDEDGEVGPLTWAALVDATFSLGDRLLYLRFPYLHGADVRSAQKALAALGFAVGEVDGIFGAFTEGAVRDFQANVGMAVDGVIGPDTVRALEGLKHAWSGRTQEPPTELRASAARSGSVLLGTRLVIGHDGSAGRLAERLANLALASEPEADVAVVAGGIRAEGLLVSLVATPPAEGRHVFARGEPAAVVGDIAAIIARTGPHGTCVVVVPDAETLDDHALQSMATDVLDGICRGLGGS